MIGNVTIQAADPTKITEPTATIVTRGRCTALRNAGHADSG